MEMLFLSIKVTSIGTLINLCYFLDKSKCHGLKSSGKCSQDFKNSNVLGAIKNSLGQRLTIAVLILRSLSLCIRQTKELINAVTLKQLDFNVVSKTKAAYHPIIK